MVDFIAEMYEYAQLITGIKEFISDSYAGRNLLAEREWVDMQALLEDFCGKAVEYDSVLGKRLVDKLMDACNCTNGAGSYVKMADKLDAILPDMFEAMMMFGQIDVTEGKYNLFSSKSGFLSLKYADSGILIHSELDPMWEAHERAKLIYKPQFESFNFLGCGLGYLPWQIFVASDCSIDINIYHNQPELVQYAIDYGVLGWIPEEKLHIYTSKNTLDVVEGFIDSKGKDGVTGFFCCDEVTTTIPENLRVLVNQFDAQNYTSSLYGTLVESNVTRNLYNIKKHALEYKPPVDNNEWIVVVAGPSLDDNIDYLRSMKGKKNIVCATTVLKKLINAGIRPDLVVVLDPHSRTWDHLNGLDDLSVPIIVNIVANWRFGEIYEGERYLAPSMSSARSAEYCKQHGGGPWNLGSTVATMAIEVAIRLGAKQIDLVGLDLAYPTGKTHASGTPQLGDIDTSNMKKIPSVSGGEVATNLVFLVYIEEIKGKIKENPYVKFVNYSDVGAYFEGAIWHRNL